MMSNIVVPDYSDENLNFLNFSFPNFLYFLSNGFTITWKHSHMQYSNSNSWHVEKWNTLFASNLIE